jgi:hypothetical protein
MEADVQAGPFLQFHASCECGTLQILIFLATSSIIEI